MTQLSRTLRAEASAWIAKLHGPERSPELEEDFRAWLNADPEHANAFEHITEIWDSLASVSVGGLPRLAPTFPTATTGGPFARNRRALLAVAATLLLAAAGIATWRSMTRPLYSTQIGEQRIVRLDDGSRLHLNSDTQVDVDLEDNSRRIRLQRGEVYVEVARDPSRPFTVGVGDRTVTALGTSFVVRYETARTAVTLVEGRITVSPVALSSEGTQATPRSPETVALSPGQRITFERTGTAAIDTPRPESTAAWRRGEVVLDETALESAIEEMNRYQRQRLVLDEPAIGKLPISGIYRTGNNQDFARAIAAVYDLEVTNSQNEIHLRKK